MKDMRLCHNCFYFHLGCPKSVGGNDFCETWEKAIAEIEKVALKLLCEIETELAVV